MTPASEQPAASGPAYNLPYIWFISLVAAMGGLLFGYDWVVIGGAKPFFEKYFQLAKQWQSGWANSCALLGCLAGSLAGRRTERQLGRKKLLLARRRAVCGFFGADRCGAHVRLVRGLADYRRRGHRHGLEPVADVHRGSRARPSARPAGGDEPIDDRRRRPGGPDRQLADCRKSARGGHGGNDPPILERAVRLAVDVYGRGRAVAAVLLRRAVPAGKSRAGW